MDVRELISTYNDAWNAHDVDAICSMHAPGMVFENHTAGELAEDLHFTTRDLRVGDDFAVCEWTARTGDREWDGVDVFPLRDGLIARKDVYSASHRPRTLPA